MNWPGRQRLATMAAIEDNRSPAMSPAMFRATSPARCPAMCSPMSATMPITTCARVAALGQALLWAAVVGDEAVFLSEAAQ